MNLLWTAFSQTFIVLSKLHVTIISLLKYIIPVKGNICPFNISIFSVPTSHILPFPSPFAINKKHFLESKNKKSKSFTEELQKATDINFVKFFNEKKCILPSSQETNNRLCIYLIQLISEFIFSFLLISKFL